MLRSTSIFPILRSLMLFPQQHVYFLLPIFALQENTILTMSFGGVRKWWRSRCYGLAVKAMIWILETPFIHQRTSYAQTWYPRKRLLHRHLWPFLWDYLDSRDALELMRESIGAKALYFFIWEAGKNELVPSSHHMERCTEVGTQMYGPWTWCEEEKVWVSMRCILRIWFSKREYLLLCAVQAIIWDVAQGVHDREMRGKPEVWNFKKRTEPLCSLK